MHVNKHFSSADSTVTVKYVINFKESGAISSIDVSADGIDEKSFTTTLKNGKISFDSTKLSSITLDTDDRGSSAGAAEYEILSNFSTVFTSAAQDVTQAKVYDYTNDETLAESDAKGFVAEVTGNVSDFTWYVRETNAKNWKKLGSSETTISTDGAAKFCAVLYNIPEGKTVEAGYSYTSAAVE